MTWWQFFRYCYLVRLKPEARFLGYRSIWCHGPNDSLGFWWFCLSSHGYDVEAWEKEWEAAQVDRRRASAAVNDADSMGCPPGSVKLKRISPGRIARIWLRLRRWITGHPATVWCEFIFEYRPGGHDREGKRWSAAEEFEADVLGLDHEGDYC